MINSENEAREDLKHDRVGGLIKLDEYRGSSLNLEGYKFKRVLDDILMVQLIDTEDGDNINRGGIIVPMGVQNTHVWRVGKVLLAGNRASIKEGELIVFPNDKGIPVAKLGNLKNIVFLNEERIFAVVELNS